MKIISTLFLSLLLAACGPYQEKIYEDIQPNETAFVVPLEGASQSGQAKFDSIEFLQEKKVAAKRIYIPTTERSLGRLWFDYEWIPTVKIIKVNRKPVVLSWEGGEKNKNGIQVESRDSIGFAVGINLSAYIKEEDTARFLYNYPSGSLQIVAGNVIKAKATELLSYKFAKYDLEGTVCTPDDLKNGCKAVEGARERKGEIVDEVRKELIAFFDKTGITISTFGLVGGLAYEDKEIQEAINDNFASELDIVNQENQRVAQEKINDKLISIATAEKEAAIEFEKAAEARIQQVSLEIERIKAEAELRRAEAALKWNGQLPDKMIPANASFIFTEPTSK